MATCAPLTGLILGLFCFPFLFIVGVRGDCTVYGYDSEENLIQNGGFEEDVEGSNVWEVSNGAIEYVPDAHRGGRSVKIKNRNNRFGGVKQKVYAVTGNSMYYASSFIKTLDTSQSDMYYTIRIWVGYQEANGGAYSKTHIGRLEHQRASSRWKQLGGDLITPDLQLEYMEVFFELVDQSIEYLVDTVSLIPIPSDPLWKQKADEDIQTYRTNIVTINGQIPSSIPFCHTEIKVDLTRRDFGFGSAIQSDRFTEDTTFGNTYRQFHFDHFNWAVFANSMKWKPMEPVQYEPEYARVDTALDYLEAENITVRGHSILWSSQDNNPTYVQSMTGENLRNELYRRIDYVVEHFKGRISEWDVINEWLHSDFYDQTIGDYQIQDKIFNRSRAIDQYCDLFINDYQGLRLGDFTSAMVDQVQELAKKGVPVGGIGVQSHLTVPVPVELLRKRLQILTASGYPVSITELNIYENDVTQRAVKLDEALRVYFSNPAVRDIIFWCVSDQNRISFYPESTCLYVGEDFQPNAAGQAFENLMEEWQTNELIQPTSHTIYEPIRAFHGAYSVEVLYKGVSVKKQSFYLNPGSDIEVSINLQASDFPAVDPADDNC